VQSKLELSLEFEGCNVSYSNFFGLPVTRIALKDCVAREVEFGEADLSEAVFTGTDFQGAVFLHTNLTRAEFSGARNYAIDPTANTIKGAVFTLPEAVSLLRGFDIVIR
jgi:fluoroquinolone resistance protein